ncbi:YagK/YfjJ domain-containing protein [Yersinia enterocolitica]|uniref:YagK/YfjJ domain-containing protein n=1 Tax=Yersinia enterocolitica TaxID=630 RepID=UPI003CFF2A5D
MNIDYEKYLSLSTSAYNNDEEILSLSYDYNYLNDMVKWVNTVTQIAQSNQTEFSMTHYRLKGYTSLNTTATGKKTLEIIALLPNIAPTQRTLHPTLVLFYQLTEQYSLRSWGDRMANIEMQVKHLNQFLAHFRAVASGAEHKLALRYFQRAAIKNQRSAFSYIDNLFDRYAKLLVVRVDLSYQRAANKQITATLARQHRERLFHNMKSNRLFEHVVGYIWKLEFGEYKGFHYHMIFFFDGAKVREDVTLARLIGEYWRDSITEGTGLYFNCNARKADYRINGIGLVSHADNAMREGLRRAVTYLTKVDTFARLTLPDKGRTFGKGERMKLPDKKRGRPRVLSLPAFSLM